jgi:hypothetical protein
MGLTLTFSTLYSKTIRINRILEETRQCHRVTISPQDVLAPLSILLTLNGIILTLWSILDPLRYVRLDKKGFDGWGRVISTYGRCGWEDSAWPFVAPLCGINFCTLVLANWQAYRSRKIKSEFAESKYIALCMLLLLEALLLGVPVFLVVQDSPPAFYLTMSFMIFVICMGVLLLIFLPKMVLAADYSQRSIVEQRRLLLHHIRESAAATATTGARTGGTVPPVSTPLPPLPPSSPRRQVQQDEGQPSSVSFTTAAAADCKPIQVGSSSCGDQTINAVSWR